MNMKTQKENCIMHGVQDYFIVKDINDYGQEFYLHCPFCYKDHPDQVISNMEAHGLVRLQ